MCNGLLESLTVFSTDIIGNDNSIIGSVLNIVRSKLPLLITVSAFPLTVELLTGSKTYYLYLSDLVFTDRTGKLKLN